MDETRRFKDFVARGQAAQKAVDQVLGRPRVGGRRPAIQGELFPVGTPIHVGCGGEVVANVCALCREAVPTAENG